MDIRYCLIDHGTSVFVTSENVESLVLNSYHSPKLNKCLKEHKIDYSEWKLAVETAVLESLILDKATVNDSLCFTVTAHG